MSHHHHVAESSLHSPAGHDEPTGEGPPDQITLTTAGIDIGSATSHFVLSRLVLRRLGAALMSRFEVVKREELYRSPVLLTPYRSSSEIDDQGLRAFFDEHFARSGVGYEDLDTGVVMLTGEAARKSNARRIASGFAKTAGRFVCSAAGHHLEARMAASGSGALSASRESGRKLVNVDIGGGTTKVAIVEGGQVTATAALNVGGRVVVVADGTVRRVDDAAARAASARGLRLALGATVEAAELRALAAALAECVIEYLTAEPGQLSPLTSQLLLTPPPAGLPLPDPRTGAADEGVPVLLSGGVAEYLAGAAGPDDDIGAVLAAELSHRASRAGIHVVLAPERLRATVVGLSQFTTQLSGDTVHVSGGAASPPLPLTNLPVVTVDVDAALARAGVGGTIDEAPALAVVAGNALKAALVASGRADLPGNVACYLKWSGLPYYASLTALAQGISEAAGRLVPGGALVVLLTQDCAGALGASLETALAGQRSVVCLDGLYLSEFDFVDIGARVSHGRVVPVIVKTLVFPEPSQAQGQPGASRRYIEVAGQVSAAP